MSSSADQLSPDSYVSILLKSPFGFGKTIAACSMAVEGPIYLAYWDKKKPIELLDFYSKHRPDLLKNIKYDVFGSHNANEFLNTLFNFAKGGLPYVGVIVDSVTFMTAGAVNWSMGFRGDSKQDPKTKSHHAVIPDFDEYKVETSLVTQALDICRNLPCNIIWTAHPVPSLKMEGSGQSMKVTTVKNIVSYGNKVGAIVPGAFSEIYHLGMSTDFNSPNNPTKRIVITQAIGDDFAKTSLGIRKEIDITDKLFWEEWKKAVKEVKYDLKVPDMATPAIVTEPVKPTWVPPFK